MSIAYGSSYKGTKSKWGLLAGLVLAGATLPAWAQMGGPMVFSVRVAPAKLEEVAQSLEFSGSIEPWRTIELSAQVDGFIADMPIEEGQRLQKGDLIAQLDEDAVKIEITQLKAAMNSTRAELNKLNAGSRPEEIAEQRKRVERMEATLARAKDDWDRQQPLVEQGVVSKNEGARLEAVYKEAQATLEAEKAVLERIESGFRKEDVAVGRANLEEKQALLADAERRLREHKVVALMDSYVVERLKEPGEWVKVGDAIARLVVIDPLKVTIDVPQIYLSRVKPGQRAAFRVDGMTTKTYTAEVSQVVPRAGTDTRNFPVIMKLPNPHHELSSGLFARVLLDVGDPKPTIMVPREAVQVRGESLVVLVAERIPREAGGGAADKAPEGDAATGKAGEAKAAPSGGSAAGGAPAPPPPDALVREVEVATGIERQGYVAIEIVKGDPIRDRQDIIVLGGTRLANGMPVRILGDETVDPTQMAGDDSQGGSKP